MKSGIYCLHFGDLKYVGLAQDLDKRYQSHINTLKRKVHSNYKVREAYSKFGLPIFKILEYCNITDLNDREIFWTYKLDTINNGLNITSPGNVKIGFNSPASKYSKIQVLKIFSLAYRGKLIVPEICKRLKVREGLVNGIISKKFHTWLALDYPNQYEKMKNIDRNQLQIKRTLKFYNIYITKNNVNYKFTTIHQYCIDYNLEYKKLYRSGFSRLFSGRIKSYRGWKIL